MSDTRLPSSPPLPTQVQRPRPKSPPLAFEPTSNDALAPLISPPYTFASPPTSAMGRQDSPPGDGNSLQVIVDQQYNAITRLHEAFAAERQCWALEKERMYQRIGSLERLLRQRDHGHSPAKSPFTSPTNGITPISITSPQARATSSGAPRLPSIAEDENITPYSLPHERETPTQSSDLPSIPSITEDLPAPPQRRSSVTFTTTNDGQNDDILVEEVPISPPGTARALSPPPAANTTDAGHTPLKTSRPPTPPPNKAALADLETLDDTPTRNNTHINALLTQPTDGSDDESDVALRGPLNLPELPHCPDETNFTMDMLSRKLALIVSQPDTHLPSIFSEPSPGLAAPPRPTDSATDDEAPLAPSQTRDPKVSSSQALSPRNGAVSSLQPLSLIASHDAVSLEVLGAEDERLEPPDGGIRLKKKASTNFGAPFGSLGGFGGRKFP